MGRKSVKENKTVYQETREKLGLTREAASEKMETISPERLERLENEKITMLPADVLELSEAYKTPMLCNYYCSNDCDIGKQIRKAVPEQPLSQIAIDTYNALSQLDTIKARMLEIVGDGAVTPDEYQDFSRIKATLEKLAASVESLQLWVRTAEARGQLENFDKKIFCIQNKTGSS